MVMEDSSEPAGQYEPITSYGEIDFHIDASIEMLIKLKQDIKTIDQTEPTERWELEQIAIQNLYELYQRFSTISQSIEQGYVE